MTVEPTRSTSRGPTMLAIAIDAATGSSRSPVSKALYSLTNWKYCVMTKMKPNSVRKPDVIARLPPENRRLENTVTSSMGWVLRRSQVAKQARTVAAKTNPMMVRSLVHPQAGASMTV